MQLSWVLGVWASLPIFKNRGAFQTEWTSFHLNLMYFDGQIEFCIENLWTLKLVLESNIELWIMKQ